MVKSKDHEQLAKRLCVQLCIFIFLAILNLTIKELVHFILIDFFQFLLTLLLILDFIEWKVLLSQVLLDSLLRLNCDFRGLRDLGILWISHSECSLGSHICDDILVVLL
jgi:hypothetical protein